jgi:hypothetical protein
MAARAHTLAPLAGRLFSASDAPGIPIHILTGSRDCKDGWMTSFTSLPQSYFEELRMLQQQGALSVSPEFRAILEEASARHNAMEAARERSATDPYWQTLRPSMIREVAKGASYWTSVDLVACDLPEATAIRAALESFGVKVNYFSVGRAQHTVNVLNGVEATAPFVILSMRGDKGKLLLPSLDERIAATERFNDALTPEDLESFVNLPGRVVLSLGCETGTQALADVFLRHGCVAYIGPEGAPFGYASAFVPIYLFYELTEMRTLEQAIERLRAHDHELAMWRLFRNDVSSDQAGV